jgi:hypothetical protein
MPSSAFEEPISPGYCPNATLCNVWVNTKALAGAKVSAGVGY